jgi:sulfate transport system substrate-binding protein
MKSLLPRILPAIIALAALAARLPAQVRPTCVSYDPAREFHIDSNPLFARHWRVATGHNAAVNRFHPHSGRHTRAVIDGLEANIVLLAPDCGNWQRAQSKRFVEGNAFERIFES